MASGLNGWGWASLAVSWGLVGGLMAFCVARILRGKASGAPLAASGGRARWATRAGLILAMAGNAIGLGNFLRFPAKAAANGGGAFLVPYFLALLLLGIPLMWVEWTMGRHGGRHGHGSTPGMFSLMWKHPLSKYLGSLGIILPFSVAVFYCFIESWTLGYACFSGAGTYFGHETREAMGAFLRGYQGVEANAHFGSVLPAVLFLAVALTMNYIFLRRGIAGGIELLARWAMPALFIFALVLVVRVLTLGTPDPAQPENSVAAGMGFMWNPDFSRLSSAQVWLVAAGQIFFSLSLGQGMINTYASYLAEDQDVTLNGLTTSLTNEFAEVILGATIAIPAAVAFFGLAETQEIARQGAFDLGFVSMPVIFQKLPLGQLFGAMWFLLLFFAGVTSSVAMLQPVIAFLQDELGWSRKRAVNTVFLALLLCVTPVVAFFRFGFLDELDFWAGTLGLALFAVIEIVVFSWIFGARRGFEEMHRGAELRVPRIFRFVMQYVTPLYLIAILGAWIVQDAAGRLLMEGEDPARRPYLWGARILLLVISASVLWLVRLAWRRRVTSLPNE